MRQHNRKRAWSKAALAVTLVAVLIAGCGNKGKEAVATYKNGKITRAELTSFQGVSSFFNPYLAGAGDAPELQDMMLKQYTALKVLSDRASAASKKDADVKTKDEMKSFDDYAKTKKAELDKQMKDLKITRTDIEDYIRKSYTVMTDLDSKITDEQMKQAYDDKLKNDPHVFDTATVSHILIGTKDPQTGNEMRSQDDGLKRAQEVKTKLDQGNDFAALAKEYSDDPGSKDNGGTYENQPTLRWDPDFGKAVSTLALNQVSEPVSTQYGYHIIKVQSRSVMKFDEVMKLDDVKGSLRSQVSQGLMNDFIDKELPTLDFQSKLPQPSPSASAAPSPAASASPSASTNVSPTATQSGSPSAAPAGK